MDSYPVVTLAARGAGGMNRLYFAAKAPVPGEVKTRLGTSIGMARAATLYSSFLLDIVERFMNAPFEVAWHVTPGSWPHLEPLVGRTNMIRTQRGVTWAERQTYLFKECHADDEERVVLAATDSPQLTVSSVEAAFAALDTHDAVFGPTPDGGYYLVGMRGFHDILANAPMSAVSTLDQVLRRARLHGLSVALLQPEFDVDVAADLGRLAQEARRRPDLAHTAAALRVIHISGEERRIA